MGFTGLYNTQVSLERNSCDQRRAETAGLGTELGALPAAGTYSWTSAGQGLTQVLHPQLLHWHISALLVPVTKHVS